MIFNIILSWIHQKKAVMINLKNMKVDETLHQLGASVDYQREFNYSIKILICWIINVALLNGNRVAWFAEDISTTMFRKIIVITILQHSYHMNLLVDSIFCLSIKHMKLRFESMNKILLNIVSLQDNFGTRIAAGILLNDSSVRKRKNNNDKWAISRKFSTAKDVIKTFRTIKGIHLKTGILCREFTKIYSIQIILTMISSFAIITYMLFYIYLISKSTEMKNYDKTVQIIGTVIFFAVNSLKLIFMNIICAETVVEVFFN
ncbi:uncharacterized protein LOC130671846 [Microplitis mediator]|uniref:uncharacterized protein LOC130671846 n=1 Tax=Microplitis mediator TaxID=375433 RepID=UPI002553D562|nr:uncharacterized protein LOC130671846 [Microplitis mediator]